MTPLADSEARRAYQHKYDIEHPDTLTRRGYHKIRKQRFREFLHASKGRPCMDCGGSFPAECMDYDHRPGTVKLAGISRGIPRNWSISRLKAEIAKCDLVCANCHRVRTTRRQRELQSGS